VFYGGSLSFLFGLLPRTVKFTATGANANMMWCGQGFSQLPNGLGWGGQVIHDAEFLQLLKCMLCWSNFFAEAFADKPEHTFLQTLIINHDLLFGCQVGYYGLFIDSSFEKGMSRPSATFSNFFLAADEVRHHFCATIGFIFNSAAQNGQKICSVSMWMRQKQQCCLRGPGLFDQVFEVDIVECWLLQQPEEEEFPATSNSSVLDRFKEDRHLMDLAGRSTQASAGVREAPPEDD
jgi:hypothetical protein